MSSLNKSKLLKKNIIDVADGPRIVVFGGGTGLSTLLRGLKHFTSNLTAIVTVADNGGSSGMLREDLHILPPGDIRNCILALADTEPLMNELMNYRFESQHGRLAGQCFGNLFIAAMAGVSDNFHDAIRKMSKVLAVKGQVLPVTLQDIQISAILNDRTTIHGESAIGNRIATAENDIYKIMMEPSDATPLDEAINEIDNAEIIVLGPGSLYTSIIPHLLFPQIREAINRSNSKRVYISNIMTQPAETLNYDLSKHLDAMTRHCMTDNPRDYIDYCIVNNQKLNKITEDEYKKTNSCQVKYSKEETEKTGIKIVEAPLITINEKGAVRHDHDLLAEIVMQIWLET